MTRRYLQLLIAILAVSTSCGSDGGETLTGASADSTASTMTAATEVEDGQPTTSGTATSSVQGAQPTSTTAAETPEVLMLQGDGLGIVDFGQPAEEVTRILGDLIGSPPTDQGSEAEWVEYIGWRDLGLYVGFDTPESSAFAGASRFVGWDYLPPGGLGLVTDEGVGIGSTVAELRAAYGDGLEVPSEPDECIGDWTYHLTSASGEVQILGTRDRPPADDSRIATLHAGIGVGC